MGKKTYAQKQREANTINYFSDRYHTVSKKFKKLRKTDKARRKNYELMMTPEIMLHQKHFVRNPAEWKGKSYNSGRQRSEFLCWLFCKYPVPDFLLNSPDWKNNLDWIIIIGSGASFAKHVKGVMVKKEAHLFLSYKGPYTQSQQVIWWAKSRAQGITEKVVLTVLVEKLLQFSQQGSSEDFWQSIIVFFGRYDSRLDKNTVVDLLDFLGHTPENFTVKNRTLDSLIRLSNEWHRAVYGNKSSGEDSLLAWVPLLDASWERMRRVQDASGNYFERCWIVTELTKGSDLYHEGRVQRHCVGSYISTCFEGYSHIFTMESSDTFDRTLRKHLTLEVSHEDKHLLQVRGKSNRVPTNEEKKILNLWMKAKGIIH